MKKINKEDVSGSSNVSSLMKIEVCNESYIELGIEDGVSHEIKKEVSQFILSYKPNKTKPKLWK